MTFDAPDRLDFLDKPFPPLLSSVRLFH